MMIAIGYPLVSALPQELVFRVLFFRRYARHSATVAVRRLLVLNAAVFSYAHLMYWSWICPGTYFRSVDWHLPIVITCGGISPRLC